MMKKLKSMDRKSLCLLIAGILSILFLFSLLVSLPQNTALQPASFYLVVAVKAGFYLLPAFVFFMLAVFDGRKDKKKS